ncbi:MAG: hypothetical protein HY282_16770 [Nitrospirae bacterium]|nr:hypothetical protein [Candidatus Manganitrophaceae bacterium]
MKRWYPLRDESAHFLGYVNLYRMKGADLLLTPESKIWSGGIPSTLEGKAWREAMDEICAHLVQIAEPHQQPGINRRKALQGFARKTTLHAHQTMYRLDDKSLELVPTSRITFYSQPRRKIFGLDDKPQEPAPVPPNFHLPGRMWTLATFLILDIKRRPERLKQCQHHQNGRQCPFLVWDESRNNIRKFCTDKDCCKDRNRMAQEKLRQKVRLTLKHKEAKHGKSRR